MKGRKGRKRENQYLIGKIMKFFEELRKGVSNIISNIKQDMAAKAVENKAIKEIEHKAAFQERKKEAVKTAKYRVQLKGKKDRELLKNPVTFNAPQNFGMSDSQPQTKQTKSKKQKKELPQELFDPNTAMKMVNFNPFKTK